jgi:hypothetical protein
METKFKGILFLNIAYFLAFFALLLLLHGIHQKLDRIEKKLGTNTKE